MENRTTKNPHIRSRIAILCLLIVGAGCLWYTYVLTNRDQGSHERYRIGREWYVLETVATEEARAKGLGGREGLCFRCGMLFLFETSGRYGFWMKDMRFDIDILWVNQGQVVYKVSKASFQDQTTTYTPPIEADSVIEVLPDSGIEVGDKVECE